MSSSDYSFRATENGSNYKYYKNLTALDKSLVNLSHFTHTKYFYDCQPVNAQSIFPSFANVISLYVSSICRLKSEVLGYQP